MAPNTQPRKPAPQAPRPRMPAAPQPPAAGMYTTQTVADELDEELERQQRWHEVLLLALDRQMEALSKSSGFDEAAVKKAAKIARLAADTCYPEQDEDGDDDDDGEEAPAPAVAAG